MGPATPHTGRLPLKAVNTFLDLLLKPSFAGPVAPHKWSPVQSVLRPQDFGQEQEKRKANTGILNTHTLTKNYLFSLKSALFHTVPDIKIQTKVPNPSM